MALTPVPSRPVSPGYGILPAEEGEGLLAWSWATERLVASRRYWLATVDAYGAPHTAPLWGVWLDDGVALSTGKSSAKWRNLQREPRCTISTESGEEAVVVRGVMEPLAESSLDAFVTAYKAKYQFDPTTMNEPMFLVRPTTVFAFIDSEDRFVGSATRWSFG